MTTVTFTSQRTGKDKSITVSPFADPHAGYFNATDGKVYRIDDTNIYPIITVVCQGKCNTYDRQIGRYPVISNTADPQIQDAT